MGVTYTTVPRLWPNSTVVCIGGGPSLTREDVDACRGLARVIVVNDGYRMAPWADVLYACDYRWWKWHDGVTHFAGLKYSLDPRAARYSGVQILKHTGADGLETDPSGLRTGRNSGYQAINLAMHLGASRVLLLGYDMKRTRDKDHWFGAHPGGHPPLSTFVPHFEALARHQRQWPFEIVNCSRETALQGFRRQPIDEALSVAVAA